VVADVPPIPPGTHGVREVLQDDDAALAADPCDVVEVGDVTAVVGEHKVARPGLVRLPRKVPDVHDEVRRACDRHKLCLGVLDR